MLKETSKSSTCNSLKAENPVDFCGTSQKSVKSLFEQRSVEPPHDLFGVFFPRLSAVGTVCAYVGRTDLCASLANTVWSTPHFSPCPGGTHLLHIRLSLLKNPLLPHPFPLPCNGQGLIHLPQLLQHRSFDVPFLTHQRT